MEPELKKNSKKKTIIIVAVVAAIALAVGIGMIVYSGSPARRLQEQLDLGARYLSELDYEQAIAAYEAALEIDPKSANAYGGLVAAYGEQKDIESIVGTYARAKDVLDETGLTSLTTQTNTVVNNYVGELLAEGRVDEAQKVLEMISAVMDADDVRETEQLINSYIAEKTLVWERPLYAFILEEGYLRSEEETYGFFIGQNSMGFEYEPICFALRDISLPSDGIPEVSVFNGNGGYFDGWNYIYLFSEADYHYVDAIKSCDYNTHRVSDDKAYPGIFIEGARTGMYWTGYSFLDQNGNPLGDRIVEGIVVGGAGGELEETKRTDDAALYEAYERIGGWSWAGDENNQQYELKYYTIDEIKAMGWEAFLASYGFTSYLFTDNNVMETTDAREEATFLPDSVAEEDEETYDIVDELVLDQNLQRDLNVFLCNFTEVNDAEIGIGFYQFDSDHYDVTQLMDFAFLWTSMNQHENMKEYPDRDFLHYGITLQQINYAIERYFGFTITEQQAREYGNTSAYRYYRDGVLHWRWGNGAPWFETAIVDRASRLSDGNILIEFTGYAIEYGTEQHYYPLNATEAAKRHASEHDYLQDDTYHGIAIAKPYADNGKTRYKLLKYETDHE